MANGLKNIEVQLTGLRPMIFDRYAGDNNTQLPAEEKMYLNEHRQLTMPAINILSLLAAENTPSVCRQFFGKQGKNIALGVKAYCNLTPFEIPIEDATGPIVFNGWNQQITRQKSVARLAKGVPNPKDRPVLSLPWKLSFTIEYQDNKFCTIENLRQAITMGGTLGLGTFRPYYGRYELTGWDVN
jgi:hypothetical protein